MEEAWTGVINVNPKEATAAKLSLERAGSRSLNFNSVAILQQQASIYKLAGLAIVLT